MADRSPPLGQDSLRRPPFIVGRERERQYLRDLLARVAAGCGSLALISGEAGIGKTALVETLTTEAASQESLVLTGASYDLVTTPAFGPWIELFRTYQPAGDLPPPPTAILDDARRDPLHSQDELFAQIMTFFTAISEREPLVLVLEDLHWADPASLELLRVLARSVRKHRLLLLATYRDDDLTRQHPLYRLLPHIVRETHAERVVLQRLDRSATGDLVQARYGLAIDDHDRLVDFLDRLAEGNPFFIHELLRTLEDDGRLSEAEAGWSLNALDNVQTPPLVRQAIDGRLATLDDDARRLLEVGAIVGQDVPIEVWQRVSDVPEETIGKVAGQAVERGWLVEARGGKALRFSHALIRETLYAGVALPERRRLHRMIAEVLETLPVPDPDMVAYHYQQAGDPRAIDWLIRAGERAWKLYAAQAAIEHFSSAIALAAEHAIQPPPSAYRIRGLAYATVGNFNRARRDHEEALTIARLVGDHQVEWQALIDLGMLWAERDYDRTGDYFREALQLARDTGDRIMLGHSLNRAGNWRLNIEQPLDAAGYHQEALALFQDLNDQDGVAATLDLLGMASYLSGDLIQGTLYYQRAVDLFRELGDRHGLASSLATLTMRGATLQTSTMVVADDPLEACITDGELALQLAREIGWRAGEAYALWMLGFCLGATGRYDRALAAAERSLEIAEAIGHHQWLTSAHCVAGAIRLDLLALSEARRHFELALALAQDTGSRHWMRAASGFLASACVALGDLPAAEATLDAVLAPDTPAQSLAQRLAWCARAELALAANDPHRALAILDRLIASSPHASNENTVLRLAVLRSAALRAVGRFQEAEHALLTAQRIADEQGAHPMLWRIHLALGRLHQARNHHEMAKRELAIAGDIIDEIAGRVADEALRDQFRERAMRLIPSVKPLTPLQAAKTDFDGLTARQREVAALIAQGCSNRDIANELSISERTVESHVTAILSTLQSHARAQIAVWAVDKGLAGRRGA